MRPLIFKAGLLLAFAATGEAYAKSHPACLTDAEMHGFVAYFAPPVLAQVRTGCSTYLVAESYVQTGLPGLIEELEQGRDAAWPQARQAFFKFGDAAKAPELSRLSDRALRPLVDETLLSELPIKMSPAVCGEVNDIAEAMAPLTAGQTVHLLATILNAAAREDTKLRSCPRQQ